MCSFSVCSTSVFRAAVCMIAAITALCRMLSSTVGEFRQYFFPKSRRLMHRHTIFSCRPPSMCIQVMPFIFINGQWRPFSHCQFAMGVLRVFSAICLCRLFSSCLQCWTRSKHRRWWTERQTTKQGYFYRRSAGFLSHCRYLSQWFHIDSNGLFQIQYNRFLPQQARSL